MNLKKNALFYSFSSYNGIFPESLLIVQISQICATTEENWIALYLFFKLIQAPQVVFLRGFFLFHRRYIDYLSEKSLSFRKFLPLDFQSSIVPVLDEKLQPIR